MKIIKSIFDAICFLFSSIFYFICFVFSSIFRIVGTLILILIIFLTSISVLHKMEYARYKETGIMKNGNLCISYMCEGDGGYFDKYYNSDNNVLQEIDDFYAIDGIRLGITGNKGDVFGKVYKPINSGTSDIYVCYATSGGGSNYFELYYVEVDEKLNITYNMKKISKEQFEENTGENK